MHLAFGKTHCTIKKTTGFYFVHEISLFGFAILDCVYSCVSYLHFMGDGLGSVMIHSFLKMKDCIYMRTGGEKKKQYGKKEKLKVGAT